MLLPLCCCCFRPLWLLLPLSLLCCWRRQQSYCSRVVVALTVWRQRQRRMKKICWFSCASDRSQSPPPPPPPLPAAKRPLCECVSVCVPFSNFVHNGILSFPRPFCAMCHVPWNIVLVDKANQSKTLSKWPPFNFFAIELRVLYTSPLTYYIFLTAHTLTHLSFWRLSWLQSAQRSQVCGNKTRINLSNNAWQFGQKALSAIEAQFN